jgi:hypothetical protein
VWGDKAGAGRAAGQGAARGQARGECARGDGRQGVGSGREVVRGGGGVAGHAPVRGGGARVPRGPCPDGRGPGPCGWGRGLRTGPGSGPGGGESDSGGHLLPETILVTRAAQATASPAAASASKRTIGPTTDRAAITRRLASKTGAATATVGSSRFGSEIA